MSRLLPAQTHLSQTGTPAEAPRTLTETAPRTLGLLDQLGFWGNLGVSLLGFAGALSILTPIGAEPLSLAAAVTAIVVGSVLGLYGMARVRPSIEITSLRVFTPVM